MRKNKVLRVNIFMFILFVLMLLVLGIDYCTYFLNTNYIVSFLISLIINGIITYFLTRKIEIKNNFEKVDVIFFTILFGILAITIVYPDRCFDTFNYHLYLQENPFGDKINFDFFAGKNLNSFTYAFPDRMFYLFRYFLGYRLGVILNYLLITIIYYQVKNIVKTLIPKSKSWVIAIIAMFTATSLSLIDIVDSYYVDLISLVLLLEIFRLCMNEKITDKNNTYLLGYLGFLFGFAFVCKISNLVTLVVLFLIYIFRNKNIVKYINLKNILITLCALIVPFIIYITYTYLETGNPVFPFYNTVFHSKYFGNWDWLDTKFGPQRIRHIFIYPVLIIFKPEMAYDSSIVEPIWGYGYVIAIMYVAYYLYKKLFMKDKIDNNRMMFFVSLIALDLVWAKFQLGYTRYGFITLVLGSISAYIFIYDIIKNKKYILIAIMSVLMLYNFSYMAANYMYLKQNWIYNNMFNTAAPYDYNFNHLFSKGTNHKLKFEDGSVWGIVYFNAGYAQMINSDIPTYNLTNGADGKYAQKLLDNKLNKATHIYTLSDSLDIDRLIEYLNRANYKIIDVKKVVSMDVISRPNSFTYIFEIEKSNNYENNYTNFETKKVIDVRDTNNLSFYLGIEKDTNGIYQNDLPIKIIGDGQVIDTFDVSNNGSMIKYQYDVSTYKTIEIVSKDESGELLGNWFNIINVEVN